MEFAECFIYSTELRHDFPGRVREDIFINLFTYVKGGQLVLMLDRRVKYNISELCCVVRELHIYTIHAFQVYNTLLTLICLLLSASNITSKA